MENDPSWIGTSFTRGGCGCISLVVASLCLVLITGGQAAISQPAFITVSVVLLFLFFLGGWLGLLIGAIAHHGRQQERRAQLRHKRRSRHYAKPRGRNSQRRS